MADTALYSPRLDEALRFSAEAFRYRKRKGSGVPYLTHLLQVMVIVAEHGGSEEQLIAALLHDYLEDIPDAKADDLSEKFGARVVDLVEQLTESIGQPKPPWKERKLSYVRHIRRAPPEVRLISAADKYHNATSLRRDLEREGVSAWTRFTASPEETLWFYRAVLEALREGWQHPLLDSLDGEVHRLHHIAGVPRA